MSKDLEHIHFLDLAAINERYAAELSAAAERVVRSGWYIRGAEVEAFEREFAHYCGLQDSVGVANGLDALVLILRAYVELGRLEEGAEIIVPSNTYIASILGIRHAGMIPVLVEPDPNTFNLRPKEVSEAITERTGAVMQVHLYGRLSHISEMRDLCDEADLLLIEDAAQAQGAEVDGRRAGAWGDAAGFSFYPGKNLGALGDAGAVTSSDPELLKTVRTLGNYGSEKKYEHTLDGYNSRLDEIQAAMLRVRLNHLDADNRRRWQVASLYNEGLTSSGLTLPVFTNDRSSVWHIYPVLTDRRDALMDHLKAENIHTLIHYPTPPHLQGALSDMADASYPVSERIHRCELSLPIGPTITDQQVGRVIDAVNRFAG